MTSPSVRRRLAELEGAEEANERARALLTEQRRKLAEAREFLQDRQESIAALQAQLAVKDAQVSPLRRRSPQQNRLYLPGSHVEIRKLSCRAGWAPPDADWEPQRIG